MRPGRKEFVFALIILLGTLLQTTDLSAIAGVKPNIALALLITLSYFTVSFGSFGLLTALAAALLAGAGADLRETLAFATLALAAFVIGPRLPGKGLVNSAGLAALGTILFYLAVAPPFLGTGWRLVALEAFANALASAILFVIFRQAFPHAYAAKARSPV